MQVSQPNEHGVLPEAHTERVAACGRAFAAVTIAVAPDGLYRYGLDLHYSYGGFGFPIWADGAGFPTPEAARTAGLEELLRRWPKPFASEPESVHAELKDLYQQVEAHVRQPSLF